MLKRQKVVLALLDQISRPLSSTELVKLMFLLKHETILKDERTFYDFVPYKYGPFSFALYRERSALKRDGYISDKEQTISLISRTRHLVKEKANELPREFGKAIEHIIGQYGTLKQKELLRFVYERYPWYAIKSELMDLVPKDIPSIPNRPIAVYTIGYESKSVDGFFGELLRKGIRAILDVRFNPISRKYGFARKSMSEIAKKLGVEYQHFPELGIHGSERVDLNDFDSYQRLLDCYEREMLPPRISEVKRLVKQLLKMPSVLLCLEKDANCCHRGRLALAISEMSGLPIEHL